MKQQIDIKTEMRKARQHIIVLRQKYLQPKTKVRLNQRGFPGKSNPSFKHGGYYDELLSEEEKDYFSREKARYEEAYPYLREPAMEDILCEFLMVKLRIRRIHTFVMSPNVPMKETIAPTKLLDQLQRTLTLMLTRMGITYVSRQRRKQKTKVKSPLEMITENGDEE